ncbi:hypothetical protein EK21DRAFT_31692, partial [Setomelanomma holmii]
KLRSAGPLPYDPDTERTKARVTSGGTAAQIAEEAYRVCRLNASLRRDVDAANQELHSPTSHDNDSARIKNRLDTGASGAQIAEEAYRVCRINAYIKKNADAAQADLRLLKKKNAITEDALKELRPEAQETRKVLERVWKLLESRKIKIPEDLAAAYAALNEKDGHDWQDEKRREFRRKKSGAKDEGKTKEVEKKAGLLLHTHEGRTYDMRMPLAEQDEMDEEEAAADAETDDVVV